MDKSFDMLRHYRDWDYLGRDPVARVATGLFQTRRIKTPLSPYVQMTDPARTPDPVALARTLPRGAAIIYRHFGADNKILVAKLLRDITFERGVQLLIGADPELAIVCGADGVHFPRKAALYVPGLWRKRCPDWIITMAGLKDTAAYSDADREGLSLLDGVLISSVFDSKSPSAGEAIGIDAFKTNVQTLNCPVWALGGINIQTAHKLIGTGAAGLAGVSFAR